MHQKVLHPIDFIHPMGKNEVPSQKALKKTQPEEEVLKSKDLYIITEPVSVRPIFLGGRQKK